MKISRKVASAENGRARVAMQMPRGPGILILMRQRTRKRGRRMRRARVDERKGEKLPCLLSRRIQFPFSLFFLSFSLPFSFVAARSPTAQDGRRLSSLLCALHPPSALVSLPLACERAREIACAAMCEGKGEGERKRGARARARDKSEKPRRTPPRAFTAGGESIDVRCILPPSHPPRDSPLLAARFRLPHRARTLLLPLLTSTFARGCVVVLPGAIARFSIHRKIARDLRRVT